MSDSDGKGIDFHNPVYSELLDQMYQTIETEIQRNQDSGVIKLYIRSKFFSDL
jgi:hypothetical protein